MLQYGDLFFSSGCMANRLSADCAARLLDLGVGDRGRLTPAFAAEVDALFESDAMVQVQVDKFNGLLTSVVYKLNLLYPGFKPKPYQVQWGNRHDLPARPLSSRRNDCSG